MLSKPVKPRITIRRVLFRLHWIAGLTAGLVLAVVGMTGALIGYETEWLAWLNPQYRIEALGRQPLPLDRWIAGARAGKPGLTPHSVAWEGDEQAIRVRLSAVRGAGDSVAVDPYSGSELAPQRGAWLFALAEDLHRRLAAGPVGKRLVGASTVLLIAMIATGIYLRWPGRPRSLAAWLKPGLGLRGRSLLRNLHAVLGTWLLASYLLAALTGLWWSYDTYRDVVNRIAGVEGPMRRPTSAGVAGAGLPSLDRTWLAFRTSVPEATRASLTIPTHADRVVEIRYQDARSAHERAWNTIRINRESGAVVERQAHAEQPAGRRFISALYPLHSGSYFGSAGRIFTAFASLLMPFFAASGFCLWWLRRRQASRRSTQEPAASIQPAGCPRARAPGGAGALPAQIPTYPSQTGDYR